MARLTPEQISKVSAWVAEGATPQEALGILDHHEHAAVGEVRLLRLVPAAEHFVDAEQRHLGAYQCAIGFIEVQYFKALIVTRQFQVLADKAAGQGRPLRR